MKIIKQALISLVMSLLFINIAVANNYIPVLKIEAGVTKKFYLSLENVSAQTSIQVIDEDGFVLIEQEAAAYQPFKKVFNMDKLVSGDYTLVIKSNYKEVVQPIEISGKKLTMDESLRKEYYPAIISQKKQAVNLSLLNPTKNEINVSIIDNTGNLIFRDAHKDQLVIQKSYNLKHLPAGSYMIVVDTSRDTYTQQISLR